MNVCTRTVLSQVAEILKGFINRLEVIYAAVRFLKLMCVGRAVADTEKRRQSIVDAGIVPTLLDIMQEVGTDTDTIFKQDYAQPFEAKLEEVAHARLSWIYRDCLEVIEKVTVIYMLLFLHPTLLCRFCNPLLVLPPQLQHHRQRHTHAHTHTHTNTGVWRHAQVL